MHTPWPEIVDLSCFHLIFVKIDRKCFHFFLKKKKQNNYRTKFFFKSAMRTLK